LGPEKSRGGGKKTQDWYSQADTNGQAILKTYRNLSETLYEKRTTQAAGEKGGDLFNKSPREHHFIREYDGEKVKSFRGGMSHLLIVGDRMINWGGKKRLRKQEGGFRNVRTFSGEEAGRNAERRSPEIAQNEEIGNPQAGG